MTDAPERIWAVSEPDDESAQILGEVYAQKLPDGMVGDLVEYIRADLARPRVKPLEWVRSMSVGEVHEAQSIFGEYICGIDNEDIAYGSPEPNPTSWLDYSSLEEAKAAAQADFERRIMECLL